MNLAFPAVRLSNAVVPLFGLFPTPLTMHLGVTLASLLGRDIIWLATSYQLRQMRTRASGFCTKLLKTKRFGGVAQLV
jgi:hypothetical protein